MLISYVTKSSIPIIRYTQLEIIMTDIGFVDNICKNRRNYGDSLVNKKAMAFCSQESYDFSRGRFRERIMIMNNMATQPCRFCLDASCDPEGELTTDNDYSSISVGHTISSLKEYEPINSYNISIESGRGKPLRIAVTYWNEYGRNGYEVGVYEPKFCPRMWQKVEE